MGGMLTIGLFGTCDKHPWRQPFMAKYDELGVTYFNPVVENWTPGCIPVEAHHLREDEIILFPVLGWSYGVGSLSELGFGPLRAMRQNMHRSFVFYIETEMDERLTDPERCKDSVRARKLLLGHLADLNDPNVYIVASLDEMLEVSLKLWNVHRDLAGIRESLAG